MCNFGGFASPERELVFDVNDFDETLPGPWEWDVKRLAASIAVLGREREFGIRQRRGWCCARLRLPRPMRRFAGMRNLDVWYAHLGEAELPAALGRREPERRGSPRVRAGLEKARHKDSLKAMRRLTEHVDGELRIISDPPLVVPIEELLPAPGVEAAYERMRGALAEYRLSLQGNRRHLLDGFSCSTSPTRLWAWAGSGRAPGSSSSWGATRGPAVSPGQGGERLGSRAVRGQEAASPPMAAG